MGEGRGRRGEGGKLIRALQSLWFSCTRFKRLPEAKFTGSKLAFKNRIRRHQRNQRPLREFRRASAGFYPFDHHSNSIPPFLLSSPPLFPFTSLSLSLLSHLGENSITEIFSDSFSRPSYESSISNFDRDQIEFPSSTIQRPPRFDFV